MPLVTPQQISKAVIREMVEDNKDVEFAKERLVALWEDAFPVLAYIDDAESLKNRAAQSRKAAPARMSPTEGLKAEITFDELWGEDINDQTAYAGLAMEAASEYAGDMEVKPVELYGHLAEGLTRSQLARTGFKEHGGLVVTLLNPMLDHMKVKVRLGSHMFFRAQRYRVAEKTKMVKWDLIKGELYTAVNLVV